MVERKKKLTYFQRSWNTFWIGNVYSSFSSFCINFFEWSSKKDKQKQILGQSSSLSFNGYFNKTAKLMCNMKKLSIEISLKQNNFKSLFDLILLQLLGLCISFPLFNFSTPNKLKRNNFNLQLKVFPQS